MKTELIEYHRRVLKLRRNELRVYSNAESAEARQALEEGVKFHERAVAWLEQIPDTFSAAATFLNEVTNAKYER